MNTLKTLTPRPRIFRVVLIFFTILFAALIGIVLFVSYYDWNRAKPWLNQRTSEAIGRSFSINGDLSLTWQRGTSEVGKVEQGWRRFVPWPYLQAEDIHVGHPQNFKAAADDTHLAAGEMATMQRIRFGINPLALLHKQISIPVLELYAPVIDLQRDSKGNNNWTFPTNKQNQTEQKWKLDLQRLVLAKGQVHLHDALKQAKLDIDIDTTNSNPNTSDKDAATYGVNWRVSGSFHGEAVTGEGRAGNVLSLTDQDKPYPIDAKIQVAKTKIAVIGTITKPTEFAAFDLRLKMSGVSMATLYPILGVLLPETPPFSTEGRLHASLNADSSDWRYEEFTGKVGSSDIGGTLAFRTDPARLPRPILEGKVVSRSLNFADLGPIIGADSNTSKQERGAQTVQPKEKALPVEQFKTGRWTSVDANVFFNANKIIRDKSLPINKLNTHIILKDGVVSLLPLNFEMAGGQMSSDITLDGSGREGKNSIRATIKINARHLQINQLFPTLKLAQASIGEINGEAALSAVGNSISSLLGASNGEVKALIDHGTISKILLEQMGLNVGNIVVSRLFGDKQVQLLCMASDFVVTNGVMQTRAFIVDTDEALINIDGTINIAKEELDMRIRPETKGFRLFSLRSPLYVRGTFKQPDVNVDKGALATRAGGAAALAAVAPFAALLPLINTGKEQVSSCPQLLSQSRKEPEAPAPGVKMRGGRH
jgi:AsmA family protein